MSVKGLWLCWPLGTERRHEFSEVRKGIMRAGRSLRMVLHGEERQLPMSDSLYGSVVQVQVRHFECWGARDSSFVPNHSEAMVLRRDQHLVIAQVLDWMVATSVTVGELRSAATVCQADQLMAKTDSKSRKSRTREVADRSERVVDCSRISRTVGKKETIGL